MLSIKTEGPISKSAFNVKVGISNIAVLNFKELKENQNKLYIVILYCAILRNKLIKIDCTMHDTQ